MPWGWRRGEVSQGSQQRREAVSSCSRGGEKKKLQILESVGSSRSFHVGLTDPVWAAHSSWQHPCVGGVLRTKVHCCHQSQHPGKGFWPSPSNHQVHTPDTIFPTHVYAVRTHTHTHHPYHTHTTHTPVIPHTQPPHHTHTHHILHLFMHTTHTYTTHHIHHSTHINLYYTPHTYHIPHTHHISQHTYTPHTDHTTQHTTHTHTTQTKHSTHKHLLSLSLSFLSVYTHQGLTV